MTPLRTPELCTVAEPKHKADTLIPSCQPPHSFQVLGCFLFLCVNPTATSKITMIAHFKGEAADSDMKWSEDVSPSPARSPTNTTPAPCPAPGHHCCHLPKGPPVPTQDLEMQTGKASAAPEAEAQVRDSQHGKGHVPGSQEAEAQPLCSTRCLEEMR